MFEILVIHTCQACPRNALRLPTWAQHIPFCMNGGIQTETSVEIAFLGTLLVRFSSGRSLSSLLDATNFLLSTFFGSLSSTSCERTSLKKIQLTNGQLLICAATFFIPGFSLGEDTVVLSNSRTLYLPG